MPQIVAMHKMQQTSMQLRQIGFEEWQAAAAVQLCGCLLHPAVQLLLEGRVASLQQAQQILLQKCERLSIILFREDRTFDQLSSQAQGCCACVPVCAAHACHQLVPNLCYCYYH